MLLRSCSHFGHFSLGHLIYSAYSRQISRIKKGSSGSLKLFRMVRPSMPLLDALDFVPSILLIQIAPKASASMRAKELKLSSRNPRLSLSHFARLGSLIDFRPESVRLTIGGNLCG